tara:strand:+ start:1413 stop:1688 length:276 start_codon:yes stop_codon:yes gene_type:complete
MLSFAEFHDENLDEAVVMKNRIRKGKKQRVRVSSKKGAGYTVKNGREVRIAPADLKKMSIRNKRSARKSKGKRNQSNMKRARSMTKRRGFA